MEIRGILETWLLILKRETTKEIYNVASGQSQLKKDACQVKGKCSVDPGDQNLKFGQRSGKPPSMAMDFVDPHFGNYLHGGGTRSHNNE